MRESGETNPTLPPHPSVGRVAAMFGRRKDDEDPFAALKDGGTYHSDP